MPTPLSGPGVGLPLPQSLYPSALTNAPLDAPNNMVGLAPGNTLPLAAGDWYVSLGKYCVIQFLDPVNNTWRMGPTAALNGGVHFVKSDGFSVRVANLTGCPVQATIDQQGGGWVQATTTITPTPNNGSTWQPIIGGALTQASLIGVGAGYGVAPLVLFPAPPGPDSNSNGVGGIQATGYAVIASGTVSGVSFTNPGAGYASNMTLVLQPNPTDPNLSTGITLATVSFSLTNAGAVTGVLCTNNGAPLSNPNQFTLSISGAGSNATIVGNAMQAVTAASVSGAGTGYGTVSALLTTVGGTPGTGTITNGPDGRRLSWLPRQAQVGLAVTNIGTLATQVGAIYDGGLFVTNAVPNYVIVTQDTTQATQAITAGTIALTMGGVQDFVGLQPAP